MSTKLIGIAEKAKLNRKLRFTSLAHLITPEFLQETWHEMNQKGASGVDGETMEEYGTQIKERITALCNKVKAGQYRALPVRRVNIPKGQGKLRPLGIPAVEDRLLQRAVAKILGAIYEQDFLNCSYGFRPNRNPHNALRDLRSKIMSTKVRYVFEADIKGYFNSINQSWLKRMVEHRIADPMILRLIGKWLNAGVMINGLIVSSAQGTPQGGPISPLLANVYLHYVLDLWFEKKCRPYFRGQASLVRFADDFVICFQDKRDADRFIDDLNQRMSIFGLELEPEKTRLILFGRYAKEQRQFQGVSLGTFEYLGFKHVCGTDLNGRYAVIRIPCHKSCRRFLDTTYAWLRSKIHRHRRIQQQQLKLMLNGFYQYFSLHQCKKKLSWVKREVELQWIRVLREQSQRHHIYWSYLRNVPWFELPCPPNTLHPNV